MCASFGGAGPQRQREERCKELQRPVETALKYLNENPGGLRTIEVKNLSDAAILAGLIEGLQEKLITQPDLKLSATYPNDSEFKVLDVEDPKIYLQLVNVDNSKAVRRFAVVLPSDTETVEKPDAVLPLSGPPVDALKGETAPAPTVRFSRRRTTT